MPLPFNTTVGVAAVAPGCVRPSMVIWSSRRERGEVRGRQGDRRRTRTGRDVKIDRLRDTRGPQEVSHLNGRGAVDSAEWMALVLGLPEVAFSPLEHRQAY